MGISIRRLIQVSFVVVACISVIYIAKSSALRFEDITPLNIKNYILSFGMLKGSLVFLGIYIFSVRPLVPIPPTLYTIAGGFTFGPIWGTVLSVTGATLNASLTFLIARLFGRQVADRILGERFRGVGERLNASGFKGILLLRSFPFGIPFDLISYASGVLKVPFWSHFFATAIGIIPIVFVFSYFGSSVTRGGFAVIFSFFAVVVIAVVVPWYLNRRKIGAGNLEEVEL